MQYITLQFLIINCCPSIVPGSLPLVLPTSSAIVKSAGSGLPGLSLEEKSINLESGSFDGQVVIKFMQCYYASCHLLKC